MNHTNRRGFIKQSALLSLMASLPLSSFSSPKERLFKMSLNPGAIGVQLNQNQLLDSAIKHGFEAIVPLWSELADKGPEMSAAVYDKMQKHNVSWDAAGLPVEFRQDESKFQEDIKQLKKHAATMRKIGIKACSTWIMPTNASLTYLENFKQHSKRLKAVAQILGDTNMKLGLEYVGPKTLMTSQKHPFISSLKEVRELISDTGTSNIGVQLDSFHWYCAEETKEDLLSLNPEEIITCDLNDAVKGRTVDQQLDYQRELPGVSGVIDLATFLDALVTIKYKGAIRAEPFNAKLNDMEDQAAMALTKKQLDQSFNLIH